MSEWNEDDPDWGQKIAQEDVFYGNQQIYNSRLDDYEKDMNCEYLSEKEREYAKQQFNEVYIEKRDAIDEWKQKHSDKPKWKQNRKQKHSDKLKWKKN